MKPEVIRQRGLGAVALLVLGGVVWLLLFGADPELVVDRRTQIPPAPELAPFEVEEPQPPGRVEPVDTPLLESESTASTPGEPHPAGGSESSAADDDQPIIPSAAEPAAQPEPGLDSRGLPEAWVVQVASFGNADNAALLRDRLREQGFKAYTESVTTGGGRSTRVLVGPKLSRGQAEQDKAAIDKAFGLNSLVSRFDPNDGR